eukprot:gene5174-8780_t
MTFSFKELIKNPKVIFTVSSISILSVVGYYYFKMKEKPKEKEELNKEEKEFYEWAIKNGAIFPKIKIKNYGDFGLGGELIEDLESEEEIISIPLKLAINYKTIQNNEFVQVFKQYSKQIKSKIEKIQKDEKDGSILNNSDNFSLDMISLYLFLIFEKNNQNSFFKEWFKMLPSNFDTFPLFFDEDDLNSLEGSNLYNSTLGIKERVESLYNSLFPFLSKLNPKYFDTTIFTLESLKWAYSTVWSRVFPFTYENITVPTLLPVIEILNHQFGSKIIYFTDKMNDRFSLKTETSISKGVQIFNNYGGKSNESFLFSYGFVIENNTEDTFFLQIGYQNFSKKKLNLIKSLNLSFGFYLRKDKISNEMLKLLRICVMNDEEIYFYNENKEIQSYSNEIKMLETFQSLIVEKENKFKSKLKDDLIKLNTDQSLNYKSKSILIYLIGQKEILKNCLKQIDNLKLNALKYQKDIDFYINIKSKPLENENINDWLNNITKNNNLNFIKLSKNVGFESKIKIDSFQNLLCLNQNIISIDLIKRTNLYKLILLDQQQEEEEEEEIFYIFLIYLKYLIETCNDFKIEQINSENNDSFISDSTLISNYSNFILNLPKTFNNSLFLNEQELDSELIGTDLYSETVQIIEYLNEIKNSIRMTNKNEFKSYLTIDNLKWSFTIYSIYSMNSKYIIPIPSIPIFNSSKLISKFYNEKENTYSLDSISTFEKNEIISSNHYLTKSNHDLLLYFGFAIDKNPNEILSISLQFQNNEFDLSNKKRDVLNNLNLDFDHFLKYNHFPSKLLRTLNILYSSDDHNDFGNDFKKEIYLKSYLTIIDLIESLKNVLEENYNKNEKKPLRLKQYQIYKKNLIEILDSNLNLIKKELK